MAERIELLIDGESSAAVKAVMDYDRAIERLQGSTADAGRDVNVFANRLHALGMATGAAAGSAAELAASHRDLELAAEKAGGGVARLNQKLANMKTAREHVRGLHSELDGVADTMLRVGAVGAVAAGASVMQFASLDKQMAAVRARTAATADEMAALAAEATRLGNEKAYAQFSAGDVGAGMSTFSQRGFSPTEIAGGLSEGATAFAAVGDTDLPTAASVTADAVRAFNLAASDAPRAIDALVGASLAGGASMTDLGASLSQASAAASATNRTIEEFSATLGLLASKGLTGGDAGTSLKTFLVAAATATEDSAAGKEMLKYQVELRNAQGGLKSMGQIAEELRVKLGGLTETQRLQALTTMFGTDALRVAVFMSQAGAEGFAQFEQAASQSGLAVQVATDQNDSLQGALEGAKSSIETAAIALGEDLAPTVEAVAGAIGDFASLVSADTLFGKLARGGIIAAAGIGLVGGATLKVVLAYRQFVLVAKLLNLTRQQETVQQEILIRQQTQQTQERLRYIGATEGATVATRQLALAQGGLQTALVTTSQATQGAVVSLEEYTAAATDAQRAGSGLKVLGALAIAAGGGAVLDRVDDLKDDWIDKQIQKLREGEKAARGFAFAIDAIRVANSANPIFGGSVKEGWQTYQQAREGWRRAAEDGIEEGSERGAEKAAKEFQSAIADAVSAVGEATSKLLERNQSEADLMGLQAKLSEQRLANAEKLGATEQEIAARRADAERRTDAWWNRRLQNARDQAVIEGKPSIAQAEEIRVTGEREAFIASETQRRRQERIDQFDRAISTTGLQQGVASAQLDYAREAEATEQEIAAIQRHELNLQEKQWRLRLQKAKEQAQFENDASIFSNEQLKVDQERWQLATKQLRERKQAEEEAARKRADELRGNADIQRLELDIVATRLQGAQVSGASEREILALLDEQRAAQEEAWDARLAAAQAAADAEGEALELQREQLAIQRERLEAAQAEAALVKQMRRDLQQARHDARGSAMSGLEQWLDTANSMSPALRQRYGISDQDIAAQTQRLRDMKLRQIRQDSFDREDQLQDVGEPVRSFRREQAKNEIHRELLDIAREDIELETRKEEAARELLDAQLDLAKANTDRLEDEGASIFEINRAYEEQRRIQQEINDQDLAAAREKDRQLGSQASSQAEIIRQQQRMLELDRDIADAKKDARLAAAEERVDWAEAVVKRAEAEDWEASRMQEALRNRATAKEALAATKAATGDQLGAYELGTEIIEERDDGKRGKRGRRGSASRDAVMDAVIGGDAGLVQDLLQAGRRRGGNTRGGDRTTGDPIVDAIKQTERTRPKLIADAVAERIERENREAARLIKSA